MVEQDKDEEYEVKGLGEFVGFHAFHVSTYDQILLNMVDRELLCIVKDTGSSKFFRVRNPELITEVLEAIWISRLEQEIHYGQ